MIDVKKACPLFNIEHKIDHRDISQNKLYELKLNVLKMARIIQCLPERFKIVVRT